MTKKLVFIHGRSQQNKDASALKKEWIAAFREGLERNNLELPIPETDIRFPYYGDTLHHLAQGLDPATAAAIVVKGTGPADAAERRFMQEVIKEIAEKAGITEDEIDAEIGTEVVERGPLNWGWVQGILKVIDRKVPFGSSASIALFTKDVYQYLTNAVTQEKINGVRAALNSNEPTVVVSHSLGTVVAYNLVRKEGKERNWQIPAFITVGSPLGVKKIRQTLAPIIAPVVGSWFNAYDERDVVALYPLKSPFFDVSPLPIINKNNVKNQTENRHGISGYLNDPEVAKKIYDAII
jgi:hypothetical protein